MPTEAEVKAAKEHVRKNEEESKRIAESHERLNEATEKGIAEGLYTSRAESRNIERKKRIEKQKKAELEKALTVENTQCTPDADQAIKDKYFNDFRKGPIEAVEKANEISGTLADVACSLNAACRAFETITGNRAASNTGEN